MVQLILPGLRLIPVMLFILMPYAVHARNSKYKTVHYTIDNGLPQSSVTSIGFDKKGYCWLGTEAGLVRFDGHSFRIYGISDLKGLQSERIRLIAQDTHGTVHVRTSELEQIVIKTGTAEEAPYPVLNTRSAIWMLSEGSFAMESPMMRDRMMASIKYRNGDCRGVATRTGDIYLQEGKKKYYIHQDHFLLLDSGATSWDNSLLMDDLFVVFRPAGQALAWKNGLLQRDISGVNGIINENQKFRSGKFTCLNSGRYNFIYAGNTMYRVFRTKAGLQSEIAFDDVPIPTPTAICFHEKNKQYFVGSLTAGLYIISSASFQYPVMPQDAIDDGFRVQAVARDGEAIISQRYLFRKDGTFKMFPIDRLLGVAAYLDGKQDLYYGNTPTLYAFNIATGVRKTVMNMDYRPSAIVPDQSDSSCLWVCSAATLYKIKNGLTESSRALFPSGGQGFVLTLVQTGSDSFLLGTTTGIKWYDYKRGLYYHSALDSIQVQNIYREGPDRIWVSSLGKGLYLYEKGKTYHFSCQEYPALRTIHAIIDDGRGGFWLPTNNGIFKVSKSALLKSAVRDGKDVFYYKFSTKDNLRNNEFNGGCTPAFVWLKDSILSVPSVAGPVWFRPDRVPLLLPDRKIYVESIEVDNQRIRFPAYKGLELEADFNTLKINISSPYYGNTENQHLMYRIGGLDERWRPLPEKGEIVLNRILYGTYEIEVRQVADLAGREYHTLVLRLKVAPPFYMTWWFYLLLVVIACLIGLLAHKVRTKLLEKRNRKLEALLALQTKDLSKAVSRLQQSEQKLQQSNEVKDKVITMVLHDIRSPMRFLNAICKDIIEKHATMTPALLDQRLAALNACLAELSDFTEQFFLWAGSQHKHFRIKRDHFSLQGVFEEVAALYGDIARVNNNELLVTPTDQFCNTDRQILSTIIRNLTDNANKNTRDGKITLAAGLSKEGLVISVADTGRGVDPEQLEAFLNRSPNAASNSYGSILVHDLLYKIGSKLDVDTTPGVGTVFSITLIPHSRNPFD